MRTSGSLLAFCLSTRSALTAGTTCGVYSGYDRGDKAYFYSGDGSLADFSDCSAKCQSGSICQSFAFGVSQCLLYNETLEENFREQPGSPYLFYDRDCVFFHTTSSFTTVLPSTAYSSVPSSTAQPDTTGSTPASATSESSGGTESSETGGISSVQTSGSTAEATTAVPVSGQFGASQTGSGAPTAPSTSIDALLTRTAASTTTSTSGESSQAPDRASIASTLLYDGWWSALFGSYYLFAVFL
ncbi:hypothetical protein VP1G_10973 [Cytospora mali]|uniref:Apple domain-containing protein n=1 Tax=Cytospora mali TaxID=578113 RepID=A0A194V1F2_CYTMA|nr:hypothetical protein VP1G_10973 [Valsa mali var. pyri (nom. inval.)]